MGSTFTKKQSFPWQIKTQEKDITLLCFQVHLPATFHSSCPEIQKYKAHLSCHGCEQTCPYPKQEPKGPYQGKTTGRADRMSCHLGRYELQRSKRTTDSNRIRRDESTGLKWWETSDVQIHSEILVRGSSLRTNTASACLNGSHVS